MIDPRDGQATVERPADLTARWLTANLGAGRVSGFTVERIGTGQMSECYRIALSYQQGSGPGSVVLKVAASDPMSRQTGQALGLYEREVRFYAELAPRLGGPIAQCYHASYQPDSGMFTLLLDDAAPAQVGDEIRGATTEDAALAMTQLGRLHGPLIDNEALAEARWLNRESPMNQAMIAGLFAGFADRYANSITSQQRLVCQRLVDSFDDYLAAETAGGRIKGLVHGDYRLDNMLFGRTGSLRDLTVVDWQTVTWGPALTDVAYFLGCALKTEDRRAHYDELLAAYHRGLGPNPPMTLEQVRDGVRRQSFFGVMMTIVSSMLVERTARGDAMFLTMLDRHAHHVLDTGALELLTQPQAALDLLAQPQAALDLLAQPLAAQSPALQPDPADEAAHRPGDEPLWNESWYWDFADPEQGVGGWIRLGLMPNQNTAWINAVICGPDIPTVALLDFHAPLPADPNDVHSDTITLQHNATEPMQEYLVALAGPAQSYDDPAALLRDEPGRPTHLALKLVWRTSGTPYAYRIATRYEIACTVSGTLTVDERSYAFTAVPGQRDHSHGVRDWWSMDWVWSALHLDDGTHLHGVDLRIPGMSPVSVGYIQPPGQPVIETTAVEADATIADDGLPLATTLSFQPGPVTATIEILGHGPVRLNSPDGRVSFFPRAWAAVETADGRRGVGWLEWNRNQPRLSP